jgi:dihydroorotase
MLLTLKGGRVLCPITKRDDITDVHMAEGVFVGFGGAPAGFKPDTVLDVTGQWVLPGLVDISTHLYAEHAPKVFVEPEAALRGGITTLAVAPNAHRLLDTPAAIHKCREHKTPVSILPMGALTHGSHQLADLTALQEAGAVAMSQGHDMASLSVLRDCYAYAATFDLLVIIYPNNPSLSQGGVAHNGQVATRLGLIGIPETAETTALVQHLLLIQETGVRAHFAHLSCARSVDIFTQALKKNQPVTAGVSMAHLWLTETALLGFNAEAHVHPPFRSERDCMALREAVRDGVIGVISSDHHPLDVSAKLAPFGETVPGISGFDTLLALAHHLSDDIPFSTLLKALTATPAQVLQQPVGQLKVGMQADCCVYDPKAIWTVSPKTLKSAGHNTPFLGWELPGRVTNTIAKGFNCF